MKPPRPPRPDIPEAYPVAADPSLDLDAQYAPPSVMGGGMSNGSLIPKWAADDVLMEKGDGTIQQEQPRDPEELARQEKEYNDYDWQMFMQAVKQGS